MTQRIVSISGLRGVIGDGLDPIFITQFASAFGTMMQGGTVVVSRDGRSSGPAIKHAVLSALAATGCRCVDADIATTPTCGVLVNELRAAGGLQITASHNPVQWNGLKPFGPDGSVFNQQLGRELLAVLGAQTYRFVSWDALGTVERLADPAEPHLRRVLELIDVPAVNQRAFKVVLDCNHGSGAVGGPRLLEQLGCDVIVQGGTPDGRFEHLPEPLEANLGRLCEAVREHGADIGFAQDPDADRLAIVDNTGRYIGEELTLALAADHVLSRTPGPVVVNGSTSRVTADIADRYQCAFHRSYVGEAHVCARMREVKAILGGEGNGGVIEPRVGFVRDSFVAMAYVLDGLAARQQSLADWVKSLPDYTIVKDKITCPAEKVGAACAALQTVFPDAHATAGDGLRLDWHDRWVQVRASNTEPIIRVIAEAPGSDDARTLCREAVDACRQAVS